jgi:hypothetical protein
MTLTNMSIHLSIPALRNIIAETAKKSDEWDASPNGKMCTTLKRITSPTGTIANTLKALGDYRQKTFVDVLRKTHDKLSNQLDKLKKIRSVKVKAPDSIETKLFKVQKQSACN